METGQKYCPRPGPGLLRACRRLSGGRALLELDPRAFQRSRLALMPFPLLRFLATTAILAVAACATHEDPAVLDPALEAVITIYRQDGAKRALPEFERLAKA